MISNKTIALAERLGALHKELNQSILEDFNGKARLCCMGNLQISFAAPYDMDEAYMRSVLPEVYNVVHSEQYKHLQYKIGNVPFVSLVDKGGLIDSDVGTNATT